MLFTILLCPRREWGNKRCFCPSVRPSVCPAVAYIANNSRTQRPSVPKFGRKVLHLSCDSHTSFKVKRSKIRVTRPINADAHRAPYFPNGKTYELQAWYMWRTTTYKVKGQSHKTTWSVWVVLAQWPINRKRIVVVSPKLAKGYPWYVLHYAPVSRSKG